MVGSSDTFTKITPDVGPNEQFTIGGGWGAENPGIWVEDKYTMEIVFMDMAIAVLPFSVADKDTVRISDYEALLTKTSENQAFKKMTQEKLAIHF